jgi:two-component system, cell cycle response regulator
MATSFASLELDRGLDAIIGLTRAKDSQELTGVLLQILRDRLHADRIRLFTIANDNHDAEFDHTNITNAVVYDLYEPEATAPVALAQDPQLLACVRTQNAVNATVGGVRRAVFPVFGERLVWGLLLIDGLRDPVVPSVVPKLLEIYRNQAYTLSRTQIDPLTGLFNRQSFYDRVNRLTLRVDANRRQSDKADAPGNCFALIDIDFFKQVNDKFGHIYGDEVLLLLTRVMMRSFRHEDLLFRYGGEEFAAVLVNVDLENAARMLERFRHAVATYEFPRLEPKTVSIGLTRINVAQGVDKVVMCADKALYYAKNHGRNRVCCYETLVSEGAIEPVTVAEGDIELF